MFQFSIRGLASFMAGLCVVFALWVWSKGNPDTFVGQIVNGLSLEYSLAIVSSGFVAMWLSIETVRKSPTLASCAALFPIALLPTLIGLLGTIHGYCYMYYMIRREAYVPTYLLLAGAHSSFLGHILMGVLSSLPSYIVLAVAMPLIARGRKREHRQKDAS